MSKSEQLKSLLLDNIQSQGLRAGERFPSEHELRNRYQIGRSTVREAITSLVHEGYLTRIQGKGTFIAAPKAKTEVRRFALFLHAHGHLYENQCNAILQSLQARGGICTVYDVGGRDVPYHLALIEQIVADQPSGFILSGSMPPPDPQVLVQAIRRPAVKVAVINQTELVERLPSVSGLRTIIPDYQRGMALAVEHLVRLGHRRIALLIHSGRFLDELSEHTTYKSLLNGYMMAMTEQGLEANQQLLEVYGDQLQMETAMDTALKRPDCPTAVVSVSDFRAQLLVNVAERNGMRVPDDLAITGFYNTPWSEHCRSPLTSVSIRESLIADLAVRHVADDDGHGMATSGTVFVEPELVIRSSCGSAVKAG